METNSQRCRRYYAQNPSKQSRRVLNNTYKRKFGITLEQRDQMLLEADGKCEVCQKPVYFGRLADPEAQGTRRGGTAVVDHCHTSGKIRGILCQNCNRAIGLLRDDTSVLTSAISYLEKLRGE